MNEYYEKIKENVPNIEELDDEIVEPYPFAVPPFRTSSGPQNQGGP